MRPDIVLIPFLKAAVASGRRRIAFRQVLPRRSGAQHPENAVKDIAAILPRTAIAVTSYGRFGDIRSHDGPLFVGEIHNVCVNVDSVIIAV